MMYYGYTLLHRHCDALGYTCYANSTLQQVYDCLCTLPHLMLSANDKLPFLDNDVSTPHIRAPVADGDVIPMVL
jgi:hypothetical protein